MKKIGILIFAVAAVIGIVFANIASFGKVDLSKFVSVSWGKGIKGSGNVVTETRNVSGFKSLEAGGVFQVEVSAQKDFSVQVEADDNLLPLIKTEVINGKLVISNEKHFNSRNKILVRISAPDIEGIEVHGAAKLSLKDVKNSALKVDTSGASKVSVAGETVNLDIEVSGASKVDAAGLQAENATVDASGASSVLVSVAGDLKADASGASKIKYNGTPRNIEKRTSGASKVAQD